MNKKCEMCDGLLLPNVLVEYKTGKKINVHVCTACGLVTRDDEREDAFQQTINDADFWSNVELGWEDQNDD